MMLASFGICLHSLASLQAQHNLAYQLHNHTVCIRAVLLAVNQRAFSHTHTHTHTHTRRR